MAKEGLWTPSIQEIRDYLDVNDICVGCWKEGHYVNRCPTNPSHEYVIMDVFKHPKFQPYLKRWSQSRKKKGKKWQLIDAEEEEVVLIPPYCFDCKREGHLSGSEECPSKIDA